MMKLSDELVQGLAIGEAAVRTAWEQAATDAALAEDRVWTEAGIKACFRELLEQHPELTRSQAYMQAVMETCEPAIGAAIASFVLAKDKKNYYKQPPFMRIISTSGEALSITFPQNITREDFDRMTAEIRIALDEAELKGEQRASAKYFEAMEKDGWHSYGTPPDPIYQRRRIASLPLRKQQRVSPLLRKPE